MRFSGKHYRGIHQTREISPKELDELLSCDSLDRIRVVERIGTPSQYATIWKVKIDVDNDDLIAALKVQRDVEKSQNEIEIQTFLQPYRKYFLELYTSLWCDNIQLVGQNEFSNFLIVMELAVADLGQFLLQRQVSETELLNYILQVIDSVYYLGKFQLFHGDLHIHNVFIVSRDNQLRAVIGDFGETIGIDSITSHTSDLYRFLTSLLEFLSSHFPNRYFQLTNKIKKAVKYLNRRTAELEQDYDEWNVENRGPEGEIDFLLLDTYFEKQVRETVENVRRILTY